MVTRLDQLFKSSVAVSSLKVYRRAWVLFQQAMSSMGINFTGFRDLPVSVNHLMLFIGYLSHLGFAAASITSYSSAIAYIHKLLNLPDPSKLFVVQKLIAACNKLNKSMDSRLPITIVILQRLCHSVDHTISSHYNKQLFHTMFVISFFGLMRLGEVTRDKSGHVPLSFDQIQFSDSALIITIRHFKHNVSLKPIQIVLPAQQDKNICPVFQMIAYIRLRGTNPGPLFCYQDSLPVSRSYFSKNLKNCLKYCGLNTTLYKSHSFRIGSASYYHQLGFSDAQIRLLGRWNSNAFLKYIRTQQIGISLGCSTTPLAFPVSWP